MSREAMQMALEALELYQSKSSVQMFDDAITALREALAEQPAQQEPVAWLWWGDNGDGTESKHIHIGREFSTYWKPIRPPTPLYTPPTQRTWVGLTDEEIGEVISGQFAERNYWVKITKALEAKLKEKNKW